MPFFLDTDPILNRFPQFKAPKKLNQFFFKNHPKETPKIQPDKNQGRKMHTKKTGETIGFPPQNKNPPDDAQVLFAAIR